MPPLTWSSVHAWRAAQHGFAQRAPRAQWLDVVSRIGGLHAQLMSAAALSLWSRVDDVSPADLPEALWDKKTLVKTWAIRGTLHLLPTRDYPLFVAGLSTLTHFMRDSWLRYHGVTRREFEIICACVPQVLDDRGLTREELAARIAERARKPKLKVPLGSGWGALLKPAAFQGHLCFGPSRGQNITFVRPDRWLGPWQPPDLEEALETILRRYLLAYGPATVDEFSRWFGLPLARAKRLFKALGNDLAAVEVEGWKGWALAGEVTPMRSAKPIGTVRLLPHFDPYTVALSRQSRFLMPPAKRGNVYRPQGWIAPVIVVDGRIVGVWEQERKRSGTVVKLEPFGPVPSKMAKAIAAEAERLGSFLDTEVSVE